MSDGAKTRGIGWKVPKLDPNWRLKYARAEFWSPIFQYQNNHWDWDLQMEGYWGGSKRLRPALIWRFDTSFGANSDLLLAGLVRKKCCGHPSPKIGISMGNQTFKWRGMVDDHYSRALHRSHGLRVHLDETLSWYVGGIRFCMTPTIIHLCFLQSLVLSAAWGSGI